MLVLNDGFLARKKAAHNKVFDLLKDSVGCWQSVLAREEQFQFLDVPLAAHAGIVPLAFLLHRDVCQVHLQVIRIGSVG